MSSRLGPPSSEAIMPVKTMISAKELEPVRKPYDCVLFLLCLWKRLFKVIKGTFQYPAVMVTGIVPNGSEGDLSCSGKLFSLGLHLAFNGSFLLWGGCAIHENCQNLGQGEGDDNSGCSRLAPGESVASDVPLGSLEPR